jgi:hypothetical protein
MVTAVGASAGSRVFYSRIKGEAEEAVAKLSLDGLILPQRSGHGERQRSRYRLREALFQSGLITLTKDQGRPENGDTLDAELRDRLLGFAFDAAVKDPRASTGPDSRHHQEVPRASPLGEGRGVHNIVKVDAAESFLRTSLQKTTQWMPCRVSMSKCGTPGICN